MIKEKTAWEETIEQLNRLGSFGNLTGLESAKNCLEYLGNPQEDMAFIHIAGTNGKGSVASYTESMLRKAGYKTGLFTSPHLVDVRERIQVNRQLCEKEDFIRIFHKVEKANQRLEQEYGEKMTYFSFLFVMAVCYFKEKKIDYGVMETGLGGRFDATNTILPKICIITQIGLDHMQILGNTVEEIAMEKAGIIKPGVPVIAAKTSEAIADVLKKEAREKQAEIFLLSEKNITIIKNSEKDIDFSFYTRYYKSEILKICQRGVYQTQNAALATAAVVKLLPGFSKEAIKEGLYHMRWEGRMEEIKPGVIVDGAHNPSGIQGFLQSAAKISGDKRLVFAVAKDKDYRQMIHMICEAELFREIYVVEISQNERIEQASRVAQIFEENTKVPVKTGKNYMDVLTELEKKKKEDETIFCVGSLYFVGALKENI